METQPHPHEQQEQEPIQEPTPAVNGELLAEMVVVITNQMHDHSEQRHDTDREAALAMRTDRDIIDEVNGTTKSQWEADPAYYAALVNELIRRGQVQR